MIVVLLTHPERDMHSVLYAFPSRVIFYGSSSNSMISALTSVGTPFSFPQAHRKPFGWKATAARCPCWSPRLPCSCSPLAALELYVNRSTITAIKLLILRSFQRKGLCDSSLKAKSTTFVRNITTIRLRSQFVISKIKIEIWQT